MGKIKEIDSFITFTEVYLHQKVKKDDRGLYFTVDDLVTYDWLQGRAPEGVRITWDCINSVIFDRVYIEEETK